MDKVGAGFSGAGGLAAGGGNLWGIFVGRVAGFVIFGAQYFLIVGFHCCFFPAFPMRGVFVFGITLTFIIWESAVSLVYPKYDVLQLSRPVSTGWVFKTKTYYHANNWHHNFTYCK